MAISKIIKIGTSKGTTFNNTELEFLENPEYVEKKPDMIDGKKCIIVYKAEDK
ncbi:hypothetical protein HNP88_000787 [Methanococcus maripaludis]|uniref:Uncharacterized protein n=1 Tax=Methanococcus maripaludis TaxID=39152 RepID=A0A7J9NME0_METMI|nr:hypothetical protein [Methanococcus maripaludis]MBA2846603.1 hypothetical protein [Methanococcus maripaludis]MBB6497787.1 hypothetical protein [Methanococcus maripaludis]